MKSKFAIGQFVVPRRDFNLNPDYFPSGEVKEITPLGCLRVGDDPHFYDTRRFELGREKSTE